MEVVGEVKERVLFIVWRLGGTGLVVVVLEEDLGGLADYVAAGEWVAADVRRVWGRKRGDLSGERTPGGGSGGDLGRVLGGVVAACEIQGRHAMMDVEFAVAAMVLFHGGEFVCVGTTACRQQGFKSTALCLVEFEVFANRNFVY